jgi:macrodomain Ter protein organizer (MatP/YcbG family)
MDKERKFDKFKTHDGKWEVYFDLENDNHQRGDRTISVKFILNHDERRYFYSEEIEKLKQDLKDLGKFRIIKQGKEFLEKG